MNPEIRQLHESLQAAQNKYVYFLLAIAAASIAFAITQTNDAFLGWHQLPLALATFFWAFSFYCGCRNRTLNFAILKLNIEDITLKMGRNELAGNNPQKIDLGVKVMQEEISKINDQYASFGAWQFRYYVVGSIFFIAWHVIEMHMRLLSTN